MIFEKMDEYVTAKKNTYSYTYSFYAFMLHVIISHSQTYVTCQVLCCVVVEISVLLIFSCVEARLHRITVVEWFRLKTI